MGKLLDLAKNALKEKNTYQDGIHSSGNSGSLPSGTNYELTKNDEVRFPAKPDIIRARIVSTGAIAHVPAAELCFHCGGKGECGCAVCGVRDAKGQLVPGQCGACRGTGHLALSEDARCQ